MVCTRSTQPPFWKSTSRGGGEEEERSGRRESGEQGVEKTIGYFPEEGKEKVEERLKISLGCYNFLKLLPWT